MRTVSMVSLLALLSATPVLAQPVPVVTASSSEANTPPPADEPEIVVTAPRVFGQVETASAPVVELDEQQVASYGASSIADLVSQLAPEIGSGRGRGGRPVILVNGQRIANFREIRRYPPEAIKRVEVLPEEVALKFGYPPDQRVINFILKDNFASREAEAEYGMPTAGGYGAGQIEASQLAINGKSRLNASVDYKNTTALTEADRAVIQAPGTVPSLASDPQPADYRTLVPKQSTLELNFTSTNGLGKDGSDGQFSVNTQLIHDITTSLSGLDVVQLTDPAGYTALRPLDARPITRRTQTDTYSLGSAYNRNLGDYQFSTTFDASYADTDSRITRRRDNSDPAVRNIIDAVAAGTLPIGGPLPFVPGAGIDRSQNHAYSMALKSTLIGNPIHLPGGDAGVTLTTGYDWSRNESTDSLRNAGTNILMRGDLSAGSNLSIPVTSRSNDFLALLGDITINLAGGIDHLSDFGTLGNWTGGLVWKPSDSLTLQGSYIEREVAPGLSQLGGPALVSYNVPLYDFHTGQTVLVTQIGGGNPDLVAEHQRDLKLSANYDLKLFDRANILVEYYRNHSSNVTASFPLLTPAIEAAFPTRITRDSSGRLVSVDMRPVTFAETHSDRLRYGFNLFGRVGKPDSESGRGGNRRFGGTRPPPAAPGSRTGSSDEGATTVRESNQSGGMAFDPQRFAAIRQAFCAAPANRPPDLSQVPPPLLDRLKGPDGNIDPARLQQFRNRICASPQAGRGSDVAAQQGQAGNGSPHAEGPAQTVPKSRNRSGRHGFGPGNGQGRWSLSFYHTINLSNSILVAPGGPELDLLHGDATGSSGGVSRHQFELEGGMFYKGVGMRLSGNYASPTHVQANGLPGSSDLRFGDLATLNLRMFMALDRQKWLAGSNPGFLKNARLMFRINNIFDAHQTVTDGSGNVPLRYQPALLDPTGRFVEIEFRKLF